MAGDGKRIWNTATVIAEQLRVDPLFLAMPLMFPAGNMFIGKFSLFAEFASLLGDSGHYPEEPLPEDGSFLHAVERMYSALSFSRGHPIAYSLHPRVDRCARSEWLAIRSWVIDS